MFHFYCYTACTDPLASGQRKIFVGEIETLSKRPKNDVTVQGMISIIIIMIRHTIRVYACFEANIHSDVQCSRNNILAVI